MNNLKTKFDSFVNEELKPETYKKASDELLKLGHITRARNLYQHYNKLINPPIFDLFKDSKLIINKIKPILNGLNANEFYFEIEYILDYPFEGTRETLKPKNAFLDFESNKIYIKEDLSSSTTNKFNLTFNDRKEAMKFIYFLRNIVKDDKILKEEEKEFILKRINDEVRINLLFIDNENRYED
jgi:hypothetical protein